MRRASGKRWSTMLTAKAQKSLATFALPGGLRSLQLVLWSSHACHKDAWLCLWISKGPIFWFLVLSLQEPSVFLIPPLGEPRRLIVKVIPTPLVKLHSFTHSRVGVCPVIWRGLSHSLWLSFRGPVQQSPAQNISATFQNQRSQEETGEGLSTALRKAFWAQREFHLAPLVPKTSFFPYLVIWPLHPSLKC